MASEKKELNYIIGYRCQKIDLSKLRFGSLTIHYAHRADLCLSIIWRELLMAGRSTFLTFITIPPNHELIMRRPRFIIQNAFGGEFRMKGFK